MVRLPTRAANSLPDDPLTSARSFLEHLFRAAIDSAAPNAEFVSRFPSPPSGRTLVLGAGKAAGAMALAVDKHWPHDKPLTGLVVTRYGHTPATPLSSPRRIEIVEASHPVPDQAGLEASRRMLALTDSLTADDLVIVLISGGASASLSLPAEGVEFSDKQAINGELLRCGATISEINCVRKHLSRIKGGRLALACSPAKVVTFAISDVPGDDVATIGSGPTVADPTTCAEALEILRRYEIQVPPSVTAALESGALESAKPADLRMLQNEVVLIATPRQALQAAADAALRLGVKAHVLSDQIEGEARDLGFMHAALARSIANHGEPFSRPCVVLSGGEATVSVRDRDPARRGRGGRASEFCLGLAIALQGQRNVFALAADTDGIDGSETNAGAYVAPDTLYRAKSKELNATRFLDRNDSYSFFERIGDLVVTGPTYTNVNDFRALLIL